MDAWRPKHVEDQDTIKWLWKWMCIKLVTLLWYGSVNLILLWYGRVNLIQEFVIKVPHAFKAYSLNSVNYSCYSSQIKILKFLLHKRFQVRPTKNLKTDDTCIFSHTTQLQEARTFTTAFHLKSHNFNGRISVLTKTPLVLPSTWLWSYQLTGILHWRSVCENMLTDT
jgi:hypothetical protein